MTAPSELKSPDLDGVIAGETAISTVTGGLCYRGYPVTEFAESATFDEVAYLLLHGELPTSKQLTEFQQRLVAARRLPDALRQLLKALPPATIPMDAIRTSASILSHYDPEVGDNSHSANVRKAERLLAQIPLAIVVQHRLSKGQPEVPPRADLATGANFLHMLRGAEAKPNEIRALDVSLILYAEHEFNASTFAARVVCSTESDLHSSIVAAIGALKGALHGGANEKVMDVVRAAGGPDTAEKWIRDALARGKITKQRVPGFGHRVYKTGDVRAGILKKEAQRMAAATGLTQWEETAEIIERVMAAEKNLFPNVDWPAGRLYNALGLEVPLYTPIFVMSRVTGWSAHVIEQLNENRLIRPRARYTGPEVRNVKEIAARG
jgi:citrate synthase